MSVYICPVCGGHRRSKQHGPKCAQELARRHAGEVKKPELPEPTPYPLRVARLVYLRQAGVIR